jgi:hypothetical protein
MYTKYWPLRWPFWSFTSRIACADELYQERRSFISDFGHLYQQSLIFTRKYVFCDRAEMPFFDYSLSANSE